MDGLLAIKASGRLEQPEKARSVARQLKEMFTYADRAARVFLALGSGQQLDQLYLEQDPPWKLERIDGQRYTKRSYLPQIHDRVYEIADAVASVFEGVGIRTDIAKPEAVKSQPFENPHLGGGVGYPIRLSNDYIASIPMDTLAIVPIMGMDENGLLYKNNADDVFTAMNVGLRDSGDNPDVAVLLSEEGGIRKDAHHASSVMSIITSYGLKQMHTTDQKFITRKNMLADVREISFNSRVFNCRPEKMLESIYLGSAGTEIIS